MRQKIINLYKFEELSDEAKEKAREWWKDGGLDYQWWDNVYEDYEEKIKEVGFRVTKMYFSGFWSQGDGAMFEYDGLEHNLKDEFISNLSISPMRKDWLMNNIYISGMGTQRGRYNHENSCAHNIRWQVDNGGLHWSTTFYKWLESFAEDFEDFVIEKYKDLARDLYRTLEKEYKYLMSDECVDETIRINEYEFTEEGKLL